MKHALASPSSAEMWLTCANSLAANVGQPEGDKTAADLGTAKHEVMTRCLREGRDAASYLGCTFGINRVTEGFADDVQRVVNNVLARISNYELLGHVVSLVLDLQVPIESITGESGATGTLDIALVVDTGDGKHHLDIIDAKFGYLPVDAENNPQLKMYTFGMLEEYGLAYDFKTTILGIEQPNKGDSEWETTPETIQTWVDSEARPAARKAIKIYKDFMDGVPLLDENYAVTEKGCKWCKAKAVCPAYSEFVEETMNTGVLMTLNSLADKFSKITLIEDWVKAVRARVTHEMLSGNKIPGLKLVRGKRGNREWKPGVERRLEEIFGFTNIYESKLKSPTKILKGGSNTFDASEIEELITQSEGPLTVVPESDKRKVVEVESLETGFETTD
jgi:hypothetical protein